MVLPTNLGFPRIGPDRELKKAVEAFWAGKSSSDELPATAAQLRQDNWRLQQEFGLAHIPSNDFSMYDQVLDTIAMVGAVPPRYDWDGGPVGLDTYFVMARGNTGVKAMAMMKWFDTNYHYIVPEFTADQKFTLASTKVIDEFKEAREAGIETRPVLVGPVTFLMLGKMKDEQGSPLDLLDRLMPVYEQVLGQLADLGANWVQCDEPALVLDLDNQTRAAFETAYTRLSKAAPSVSLMLATYFGGLRDNLATALQLPVAALHVDLVREPQQLDEVLDKLPAKMALSVGVVDGRNIWANDIEKAIKTVQHAVEKLGTSRVQVGPSCSLLHSPVDLELETELDDEMKSWMAFAKQKLREIATIARAVNEGEEAVAD
ncbi:MAG: 5-methyltetrahydropteroyltriglutamate--homocysteine S-methyltransferase, partial [Planctomycetota bacterium]|nr:5-methyltetrahydropteroyltriglutamate--homocysteine S-methyltransferase [Planctomycetota bacterium]